MSKILKSVKVAEDEPIPCHINNILNSETRWVSNLEGNVARGQKIWYWESVKDE